jgi:hypothetical protein
MVELAADDVDELMDWVLDDGGGGRLCLYFWAFFFSTSAICSLS